MLGFSLGKLLILAAIVAVVWYGFRVLSRRSAPPPSESREDGAAVGIDTVYDPETDTYVPRETPTSAKRRR